MVLALIFGFLTGIAFIVLIAYITKNRRLGLPLINKDVILSTLLVIVLLFLTLQQYIIAIVLFAAGGLLFLYYKKRREICIIEVVRPIEKIKEVEKENKKEEPRIMVEKIKKPRKKVKT